MPLNESVEIASREYRRPMGYAKSYHDHLVALYATFLISEDANDPTIQAAEKIKALMKAGKWDRDAQHFFDSVAKTKHPRMLSHYSVDELKKMDTFKVPGYNIGFALKEHDGTAQGGSGHKGRVEIVAVHNNTGIPGLGDALMDAAKANGGKVLDHFAGFLDKLYDRAGFEEYKRDPYDKQYDEGGYFAKEYGEQPVIYRRIKKAKV